jgi:hypothetical protein
MISEAPLSAAAAFDNLSEQVKAYIATAKLAASDGLNWSEFGELLTALMRLAVATLDDIATMTGAEKKDLALVAAAALFDTVADRCVPLVAWPVYIIARPAIRALVLALAGGVIESLLPMVRSK